MFLYENTQYWFVSYGLSLELNEKYSTLIKFIYLSTKPFNSLDGILRQKIHCVLLLAILDKILKKTQSDNLSKLVLKWD